MEKKITKEMSTLGCKCPTKVALAYQLYLELCEVKLMYDVNYSYSADLDLVYLTAKDSKDGKVQTFVPHLASKNLTLSFVKKAQDALCKDADCDGRLTMALIENDSTAVLYTFTNGLIDVKEKDSIIKHKQMEETRYTIEAELRKNRVVYGKRALFNGSISSSLNK